MSESDDSTEPKAESTNIVKLNDRVVNRLLANLQDAAANDPGYIDEAKQWIKEMDQEADQMVIDLGLGPEAKYTVMAFLAEERSRPFRSEPGEMIPFRPKNKTHD